MHRAATKFVPKLLSVEQKELRLVIVRDLLDTISAEPSSLDLLTVLENENAIERSPFLEKRWDSVERDDGHSKRSLLAIFSVVEGMLG
ncbi:hypothetical protein TNCV_4636981 [Trichonephila clavipes]|nr:hypothetical protein TNCV_4636981 [Trichonephila clavipes]